MDRLAEEILLDHRLNDNVTYLITSAVEGEGATFVAGRLAERLSILHSGEVFLFSIPKQDSADRDTGDSLRIELFEKLKQKYSIVIIDASGVLSSDRVTPFFDITDSVIMVIKAGVTRKTLVIEAVNKLKRFKIPILGVFLNGQRHRIPRWIYNFIT